MSNDMQKAGIIKIENPQVGFVQGPDGTFAVVRGTNSNFMFGYSLVESTGGLIEIASR